MARKGSMGKDPKQGSQKSYIPTREANLAAYNAMTPQQQARYRKIRANKGARAANKMLNVNAAPPPPTQEEITEQGFRGSADLYNQMMQRFQGFDPMQAQQQYEPVYSQEMERARQNVMSQFERRNAEEFERQNIDVQRQIAERGLDPNSPAAQALMKQNTQRQDLARQEAMSAAEQAASGLQQQMYGQAMETSQMPYSIYGQTFAPTYMAGIGAQYGQQQLTQQQQFEARQAELNRRAQERIARMSRSGGGPTGPTLYEQMEMNALQQGYNQPAQQNPWATAAQGAAQGFTAAATNWALR